MAAQKRSIRESRASGATQRQILKKLFRVIEEDGRRPAPVKTAGQLLLDDWRKDHSPDHNHPYRWPLRDAYWVRVGKLVDLCFPKLDLSGYEEAGFEALLRALAVATAGEARAYLMASSPAGRLSRELQEFQTWMPHRSDLNRELVGMSLDFALAKRGINASGTGGVKGALMKNRPGAPYKIRAAVVQAAEMKYLRPALEWRQITTHLFPSLPAAQLKGRSESLQAEVRSLHRFMRKHRISRL